MDSLTKLAIKYKTDKWGKHNYTPIYYSMFRNNAKRRKVKKVLEIGVGEGAGVRMFRDFFPNATIYGAELCDDRLFREDRIEVIKCDQSKREDLLKLFLTTGLDLDLVIDDGSHKPEDQVFTCLSTTKHLKRGCIYVIEDVADELILIPIKKFYKDAKLVKAGNRYDDKLIIINL
jgi:demethylmacrocin O-methyltransferase